MLISTHVLVGTAIGRVLSRRHADRDGSLPATLALAAAAGIASHFACDSLPHWGGERLDTHDPAFLKVAVPDGLVGLSLLAAAVLPESMPRRAIVAAAALGACLPDTDKVGDFAFGRSPWPAWLDHWHAKIQRESPKLLASDAAIIAVLAVLTFRRKLS